MDKKRSRRSLSCVTCRRLKTRCDYDVLHKKCHRCHMLRLPCSLTAIRGDEEPDDENEALQFDKRLRTIEDSIQDIKEILTGRDAREVSDAASSVGDSGDASQTAVANRHADIFAAEFSADRLDSNNELAPMSVIRNIDYKIFSRNERYEPMKEGSKDLVQWIKQRPQYCHKMSAIFIQKCVGYVIRHSVANCSPLLLGVMTLQGMRLDIESTHEELQRELFPLVRSLLATGLMTSPLRHDDIEAMMYMAHFNVARKPLQPIFDSWLLTGYAVKLYILSVSFSDIVSRTESLLKHTTEHDLYLFRLWNGLCQCHLQYAVASCRQVVIPTEYLAQCSKIVLLEGAQTDDALVASEIKLLTRLTSRPGPQMLPHIRSWYSDALPLFPSDGAKSLPISYYYALVIATNRPGAELSPEQASFIAENCKAVIALFLELRGEVIEAMPNYPLCILIYVCITLCETNLPDRQGTLILMTKVYWYISHLGVKPRDITHSIANIIKSVIELSNNIKLDVPGTTPNNGAVSNTSQVKIDSPQPNNSSTLLNSQQGLGAPPSHMMEGPLSGPDQKTHSDAAPPSNVLVDYVVSSMDVTQYSSYDDFFEKVFSLV